MISESMQVHLDRPIEQVFAFLTDAANHPQWDASSLAMEPTQPGPWRPGLEFREVRRIGPRRVEIWSRIAALDPPHAMEIESLTGPQFTGSWRLEPDSGGTRLTWRGTMRLRGVQRLMQPVIARSFRASAATNFARLKDVVETSPAQP